MKTDIKDLPNNTTLGPYSFRLFVSAIWSVKTMEGTSKQDAATNCQALEGRRAETLVNGQVRKRPLAADIAKTETPALKKRKLEKAAKIRAKSQKEKKAEKGKKADGDTCIIM